jgi:pimeloyl-ACP methyl ester carboxylesterase
MNYFTQVARMAAAVGVWVGAGAPATGAETRYLARPGGVVAYDDTGGTGPLVVEVPGMGDVRGEYRVLTPSLAAAGYRVVSLDVRGHGQTSAVWPDYSAHAVGGDVLALIDHLGEGPATVIGTSFAAGSALWAAHDAPARVRGVVLISPMVTEVKLSFTARATLAVAFAGPWRVAFWGWYWNKLFPLHKPADHAAYQAALLANLRAPGRMDALYKMLTLSKADTAGIIDTVHTPALLIVGGKDMDFDDPAADGAKLAARLRGALLLVDGAGHYPQVETPDIVAPAVLKFLHAYR